MLYSNVACNNLFRFEDCCGRCVERTTMTDEGQSGVALDVIPFPCLVHRHYSTVVVPVDGFLLAETPETKRKVALI